jgi:hypothetical protein
MKFNTKSIVLFGALAAIVAGIVFIVAKVLAPGGKDTPVVIVGGCIHAKVPATDTTGWKPGSTSGSYTAASNAASPAHNIDQITLTAFDNNPGSSITRTGGWAITYSGEDAKGNEKPNALHFCSDGTCNASGMTLDHKDNTAKCTTTFQAAGPVYLFSDDHSRWEEGKDGSETRELHYHDSDNACDGSNNGVESRCDTIYKIVLETCSPQPSSATYTCKTADGHCNVAIGQ